MSVGPAEVPPHLRVTDAADVVEALATLGVSGHRPVLVVVGGASGMSEPDRGRVDDLVRTRLVPGLERHGAAVVDGGTDAGVMRLLGQVRTASAAAFPLLGVAAAGTVRLPGQEEAGPDAVDLEPGHTGVLLVPGTAWGDESPWIAEVAGRLAGPFASVTLVINGGEVTYSDVEHSLAAGRPVLVLAGSGRAADAIAEAARSRPDGPDRLARVAASPLVAVVRLDDPDGVAAALDAALTLP